MPEPNDPIEQTSNSLLAKIYFGANPSPNQFTLTDAEKGEYVVAAINAFRDGRLHFAQSEGERAMHMEHAKQVIAAWNARSEGTRHK